MKESININIVGMRYHIDDWNPVSQDIIGLGDLVELRREPDNIYDRHALACYKDDVKIGYLESRLNGIRGEGTYEIVGIEYYKIRAVEVDYEDDIMDDVSNVDGQDFFNEYEEDEFIENFERWKL